MSCDSPLRHGPQYTGSEGRLIVWSDGDLATNANRGCGGVCWPCDSWTMQCVTPFPSQRCSQVFLLFFGILSSLIRDLGLVPLLERKIDVKTYRSIFISWMMWTLIMLGFLEYAKIGEIQYLCYGDECWYTCGSRTATFWKDTILGSPDLICISDHFSTTRVKIIYIQNEKKKDSSNYSAWILYVIKVWAKFRRRTLHCMIETENRWTEMVYVSGGWCYTHIHALLSL